VAKNSGYIFGAKLYPSGATTNSQHGVTSISKIINSLKTMEKN
jgi:dihydroorotase